jgi:outer membrane protein assembly factor BamD (BamD/ComL family)
MKAHIKFSLLVSFLLFLLLICCPQSQTNAKGLFKDILSSSAIKKGKQYKSDGDYASAMIAFSKSIKRDPQNIEAYYQLGLIFEEIMCDYEKAISLYNNVINLSESVKPIGTDEELNEYNSLITNARESEARVSRKQYESIEEPRVPVYIIVNPNKRILKDPSLISRSVLKTTSYENEFRLLSFRDNWYQINLPSVGPGWVNGKNVLKILQKKENAVETSSTGKLALYERFVDMHPSSKFATDAKARADNMSYENAKKEGSIESYSVYLKKYHDGKHAEEARLKLDTLVYQDQDFLNNISRLKHWITNNPESTFIEKAKDRIDELVFAQAKYDNNTVSLEGYIIDYPEGKFVSEATQLLDDIEYNLAKSSDTIDSYKKYLHEYPDGKYAGNVAKKIDDKEFSTLLSSQNIGLLTEHLKGETNNERLGFVKDRIEELYFKKADGSINNVDAIKIYKDYILKYPGGLYVQEAKAKIETLSFKIAAGTNTKDAYREFIRDYPQSKYYKEAIDGIEVLDFNVALTKYTPESFGKFIAQYPDGKFASKANNRIEEIAFNKAKDRDSIEAYEGFVKSYPNSMIVNDAKRILETKYFENASKIGTIDAYKKHIEHYPDGSHLEKARLIIDMLTFKPYDENGSVRSLKKFIRKYPENRYVNEAKKKITQLTLVSKSKSIKPGFWIWMVIINLFSIAIISLVVLKREKIPQIISNFVKKREVNDNDQSKTVKKSFSSEKLNDKPVKGKAIISNKPTSTKGPTVLSYFMALFIPFVYFFLRKRITAGIVSLVICIVSIPLMFFFIGIFSYLAMSFWACWNLRYELMQEYTTMQAEAMAKVLNEIKERDN